MVIVSSLNVGSAAEEGEGGGEEERGVQEVEGVVCVLLVSSTVCTLSCK